MGASGSLNYCESTGSLTRIYPYDPQIMLTGTLSLTHRATVPRRAKFYAAQVTTEIPGSLTIKYYQRVFDAGLSVYCYYTKTSIDPTPLSTETSPEYTGAISDHSIVKILEIY